MLGEGEHLLQQQLLLGRLAAVRPKQLSQQLLRLLYQAHRLSTVDWLSGKAEQQQQQTEEQSVVLDNRGNAGEAAQENKGVHACLDTDWQNVGTGQPPGQFVVVIGGDSSSSSSRDPCVGAAVIPSESGSKVRQQQQQQQVEVEGGFTLHDISRQDGGSSSMWSPQLLAAAQSAAALHASTSAARSKQQQLHVQDLFEALGFETPAKGLKLDGGALQPDLAFVAETRTGKVQAGQDVASAGLKVAIMCDHAGRYSRNAPHELLGYETVSGWLLEQAGWKVVRLAPHEWSLLLSDRGVDDGSALAFLYNSLAGQGVAL